MAVRGVDNVHVAPVKRPTWGREMSLGVCAPLVNMCVIVVMSLARARKGHEHGDREGEQEGEMHPDPGREAVHGVGMGRREGVGDKEDCSVSACQLYMCRIRRENLKAGVRTCGSQRPSLGAARYCWH